MSNIKLKSNFQGATKVFSIDKDARLSSLLSILKEQYSEVSNELNTLIESNSIVLEHDYPKKKIDIIENIDVPLSGIGIKNGQQIWLRDSSGNSVNTCAPVKPTVPSVKNEKKESKIHTLSSLKKNNNDSKDTPNKRAKTKDSKLVYTKTTKNPGYCVLRRMPDDNSCLFHAISYCLFGDANHQVSLRQIVAEEILGDPVKYNKAYLGKEVYDYVTWINQENSWGGAIELEIFATHFGVEINSIDVKNGRRDTFIPLKGFGKDMAKEDKAPNFLVIFYSGIHFDALAYTKAQPELSLEHSSGDICTFVVGSSLGDEMLLSAEIIRSQLVKEGGYVTDMGSIHVLCNQCNSILSGEKALVKHMKETKHTDFQEVQ